MGNQQSEDAVAALSANEERRRSHWGESSQRSEGMYYRRLRLVVYRTPQRSQRLICEDVGPLVDRAQAVAMRKSRPVPAGVIENVFALV